MRLYIVRHAIAVPHGTPGVREDDRALTEEGTRKMRQAAAGLRCIKYVPEALLSSPLVRARQTAEILVDAFGKGVDLQFTPHLAPWGERRELYREMARYTRKCDNLMIVGHQPSLGEIAGEIVWGLADHFIDLKKGGICAIDVEWNQGIPRGTLISLLTPSILGRIASE